MANINYTGYDNEGMVTDSSLIVAETTAATPTKTALDEAMELELQILADIQSRLNQVHVVWANDYLPCELTTLALVCNKAKQTTNISYVAAQASAETTKQYAIASNSIAEQMAEACFTPECNFDNRLSVAKARSESWKIQGALRFDETRVDIENASRLNDKIAMISPGRNGVVDAANSLVAVAKIYEEMAQQAAAAKDSSEYNKGVGLAALKDLASKGKSLLSAFNTTDKPPTWDQGSYDEMRFGKTAEYSVVEDAPRFSDGFGDMDNMLLPMPTPVVDMGMDLDF